MLKGYLKGRRERGFTLIEIVVVIAIAALILAAILVFVPTVQRNRRDTQRREAVGKVVAVAENWASNNGGTFPTAAELNTQLTADASVKDPGPGTVVQVAAAACGAVGTAGPGTGVWNYVQPTAAAPTAVVCTSSEATPQRIIRN